MSFFDDWDREMEETFNDPVKHFGGSRKGKAISNEYLRLKKENECLKKEIKRLRRKYGIV